MSNDTHRSLPFPRLIEIACPRCNQRATFVAPFDFYPMAGEQSDAQGKSARQWGGYLVVERHPSIFPWTPPRTSYANAARFPQHGVVRCPACHLVARHTLSWPADAFFRWDIRGFALWAYSAEHAQAMLRYLGGTERRISAFPRYARWLRRLPREVITAKARDLVVKKISATLAKEGFSVNDVTTSDRPGRSNR